MNLPENWLLYLALIVLVLYIVVPAIVRHFPAGKAEVNKVEAEIRAVPPAVAKKIAAEAVAGYDAIVARELADAKMAADDAAKRVSAAAAAVAEAQAFKSGLAAPARPAPAPATPPAG